MFETTRQGAVDLIHCGAPLTADNIKQAAKLLDHCLQTGQPRIVLNMERLSLIDGKGLEFLVDYQKCIARGGNIKLAAPSRLCHDILTATDVLSHFEVFEDALTAAGSFAQ